MSPHVEVIKWAHDNLSDFQYSNQLLECAVGQGNLEVAQFLLPRTKIPEEWKNSPQLAELALSAPKDKDEAMVKFIAANGLFNTWLNPVNLAARKGLGLTKLIHETFGLPLTLDAFRAACQFGQKEVLEYFHIKDEKVYAFTNDLLVLALYSCQASIARWLLANGCSITSQDVTWDMILWILHTFRPVQTQIELLTIIADVIGTANLRKLFVENERKLLADFPCPKPMWQFFVWVGLQPGSYAVSYMIHYTKSDALETLRYLIEELHCPLPDTIECDQFTRKDVKEYLQEKNLLLRRV